jgi:hypothetical protein
MAQGAIFKLVLRDERFDQFFTASDFLRRRLDAIRVQRAAAGEACVQPSFLDVERTHLLYVHAAYRPYVAVASEYTRVKAAGDGAASLGAGGGALQFTFPAYGHFTSDLALHVRFRPLGSAAAAAAGAAPTAAAPLLRYCAYPGLRLLRRVELRSDQVLIDDYTAAEAADYMKFFVGADQRAGWDRCHGQQEARAAAYQANGFTGTLLCAEGPQTPRLYQPALDLFVPLQFWLGRSPGQALLNDLVPNTQRAVVCELAPLEQIVQALLPDPTNAGVLLPTPLPFARLAIEADLYVNNLYVNPEIHDLFAARIGFSLLRVHRREARALQAPADAVLLDQLKFPAEYLLLGLRDRALAADFDRWWLNGTPLPRGPANALYTPAIIWNAAVGLPQLVAREATEVESLAPFTETLGLRAHGIELGPSLPGAFYNAYLPIRYGGGGLLVSPTDAASYLFTFCLYPGLPNPSGYYNLSAGRELYLTYTLKEGLAAPLLLGRAELRVSMSALNFLMRKGDKLHLRYAT